MEFEEKQGLKIWWLYLITGVSILPALAIIFLSKGGLNLEELKDMYFSPLLALFSPFLIIFLIEKSTLTLKINQHGMAYRYFPLQLKYKTQQWENIEKAYLSAYDAFSEYGGYGVKSRLWFKTNDKAYVLNDGNRGLQFEFKNGKKLLFSTNKVEEMETFLINIKTRFKIQAIQENGGER
ncbi:hypothetical protein GJU39_17710 [Pedobacter petrophilus]|uniref:Uncharacterized protein n=1 Tax=Pedobacter petrophilus TaxID=1908241 RepID=A0A7K0G2T6_9SPHI|nr:hypothetical protein [Pedobacter petrophilus]MRX77922.1 hypothetical protein [Pedobacter petrophilus]